MCNIKGIIKCSVVFAIISVILIALMIFNSPLGFNAFAESASEENVYATGCLPDDGTIPLSFSIEPTRGLATLDNLQTSKDLSGYSAFPAIGNQGNYGSCAAYATTYYQFTYEVAYNNNWNVKTDTTKIFSPMFVYNYVNRGDLDGGSAITECYSVLAELGAVRLYEFNESNGKNGYYTSLCTWNDKSKWFEISNGDANHTARELTVQSLNRALENRITAWRNVQFSTQDANTTSPVITPNDSACIDIIKTAIGSNHVLVFNLKNSYSIQRQLKYYNNKAYVQFFEEYGTWSGHALTIVGYDDNLYFDLNGNGIAESFEYGALKVANSWGNTWGTNGYFWIPYDALNIVSNDSGLNCSGRICPLYNNSFFYINVDSFSPGLTVEADINTNDRIDCHMQLYRGITANDAHSDTLFKGKPFLGAFDEDFESIPTDFNGNTGNNIEYDTRVFVFDLSNPYYDEKLFSYGTLYDQSQSSIYYLKVEDHEEDDGSEVTVERIEWKDDNEISLFVETPNESFDGESKNYLFGGYVIDISGVSMNQDARRVHINLALNTTTRTFVVHIGSRVYPISLPAFINSLDQTINGDRVKVARTHSGGVYTWDIQIKLSQPTTPGTMETFYIEHGSSKGNVPSIIKTDFVAYDSFVKTGLTEGMTLEDLIDDINGSDTGFTYSVANGISFNDIAYDSTTKAGTGMIVLKIYNGKIAEAYYVILFGDIAGGGVIGNGLIEVDDALLALRHAAQTGLITEEFFLIAADIDHDGDVDQSDAQAILNHAAHLQEWQINQNYAITTVSNGLYYINSVEFV